MSFTHYMNLNNDLDGAVYGQRGNNLGVVSYYSLWGGVMESELEAVSCGELTIED